MSGRITRSAVKGEALREAVEQAVAAAVAKLELSFASKVDKLSSTIEQLSKDNEALHGKVDRLVKENSRLRADLLRKPLHTDAAPPESITTSYAKDNASVLSKTKSYASVVLATDTNRPKAGQEGVTNSTRGSWTKVVSKKRPVKKFVTGCASTASSAFEAVRTGYPVKVFVSRLPPYMTRTQLEYEVKAKTNVSVQANARQSRMPGIYSSYILDCTSNELKTLLDPNVWPAGLIVKRWYDHPTQKIQTQRATKATTQAAASSSCSDPIVTGDDVILQHEVQGADGGTEDGTQTDSVPSVGVERDVSEEDPSDKRWSS